MNHNDPWAIYKFGTRNLVATGRPAPDSRAYLTPTSWFTNTIVAYPSDDTWRTTGLPLSI